MKDYQKIIKEKDRQIRELTKLVRSLKQDKIMLDSINKANWQPIKKYTGGWI